MQWCKTFTLWYGIIAISNREQLSSVDAFVSPYDHVLPQQQQQQQQHTQSATSSTFGHHNKLPRVSFLSMASTSTSELQVSQGSTITPTNNNNNNEEEESPVIRAGEIASVVFGQVMSPLLGSLLAEGLPTNWETFWARRSSSSDDHHKTNADCMVEALEQLGPTYVKFGQALGSRPDVIPPSLASALCTLHDDMEPFDTTTAQQIMVAEFTNNAKADPVDVQALVKSLGDSPEPIAAASVGQVYKAHLPGYGDVAIKVQRPGIRALVERDAALLRTVATWVESIPALPTPKQQQQQSPPQQQQRLIATELVDAVDEFMSRIFEELDYRREAENAITFAKLYSERYGAAPEVQVIVPEILTPLCTENVIVMEWLEGTKLTNVDNDDDDGSSTIEDNLAVVKRGIQCTLRQLLVDGILHADPHAGNLLKIKKSTPQDSKDEGTSSSSSSSSTLGYLDFGILSTIPSQVRDGLVCAVALLVFNKDVDAVAGLFGELQLLPQEVLNDADERAALNAAMELTMSEALKWPDTEGTDTQIPVLLFDKLLDSLARLVPRFSFELPPYFINNARALSTLEGIARTLDPSFNVFQVMYPYALTLLFQNPSGSPVVDDTLQQLIRSPTTGRVDPERIRKLLRDSSLISGLRKRRVVWDIVKTRKGRGLTRSLLFEEFNYRVLGGRLGKARKDRKRKKYNYLKL